MMGFIPEILSHNNTIDLTFSVYSRQFRHAKTFHCQTAVILGRSLILRKTAVEKGGQNNNNTPIVLGYKIIK